MVELADEHPDAAAELLVARHQAQRRVEPGLDPAYARRGGGAARALGEQVLAWARDARHTHVVTDWCMTNPTSSRTWPRLGFRPTFYRLFRAIA
jgi:GNAT superfamily N-acetyltransferase